jgi:5-(carboxyamino)imidazole ribonucleotide mutase
MPSPAEAHPTFSPLREERAGRGRGRGPPADAHLNPLPAPPTLPRPSVTQPKAHDSHTVTETTPRVGIIMGSRSDRETMLEAARVLDELGIAYEMEIVSAHRTPDRMFRYAEEAEGRGIEVIIAGAGGAAHLPGMTAAKTVLPVIGVPVLSSTLNGLDSLLSIVQMPRGVPVATVAIGKAGAANAGLLAARILGSRDAEMRERLRAYAARMAEDALRDPAEAR